MRAIAAACLLAGALLAGPAAAQIAAPYPERPVALVQGFGAGGNADTIARVMAGPLAAALGRPVVVEGRTGAGGNIASEFVARSRPDGHTLILLTGGHTVSAALYRALRFDPVEDFAFISTVSVFPFVVATRAENPIRTLPDLIAAARARPGEITVSSVGVGSTQHLTGEMLAQAAGFRWTHVPYRGGTAPLADLLGGRIDAMVDSITVTGGAIRGGTVRALGVTSAAAWPGLEALPVGAAVPGFEVLSWVGLAAPAGTPAPVIARLNADVNAALETAEVRRALETLGSRPSGSTPEGMRAMVARQVAQWRRVVEAAGIERQ